MSLHRSTHATNRSFVRQNFKDPMGGDAGNDLPQGIESAPYMV